MVARVVNAQENTSDKPNFRAEFGALFKGIGKPKTEHHITLYADATPVCLYTARKIAHPLLPQIKSDIESMVRQGIIPLGNSKVFSKLDANSGFWKLPLVDDESPLLTTFITPHGRYRFNRLPFGISSAPEIFQRTMSQIREDLGGVTCHIDGILIHAADQAEHDKRVQAVLVRIQEAELTLNTMKCQFSISSLSPAA